MWQQIVDSNRINIEKSIKEFINQLQTEMLNLSQLKGGFDAENSNQPCQFPSAID